MTTSMPITRLYRYPVKSMQGERLEVAAVGDRGIEGDRSHAIVDDTSGVVLTGRLDPPLLFARGVLDDGHATVVLPDGSSTSDDATLSAWIGRPVRLRGPAPQRSSYEIRIDAEDESSEVVAWQGPAGSYHDSGRTQLSIIATGDLRDWDVRRFRPNVLVDAETVDHLVGRRVHLGDVVVEVVKHIDRCVMITRPQPEGIERDLDVLRTVRDEREMLLGVGAIVVAGGEIGVGDRLEVLPS